MAATAFAPDTLPGKLSGVLQGKSFSYVVAPAEVGNADADKNSSSPSPTRKSPRASSSKGGPQPGREEETYPAEGGPERRIREGGTPSPNKRGPAATPDPSTEQATSSGVTVTTVTPSRSDSYIELTNSLGSLIISGVAYCTASLILLAFSISLKKMMKIEDGELKTDHNFGLAMSSIAILSPVILTMGMVFAFKMAGEFLIRIGLLYYCAALVAIAAMMISLLSVIRMTIELPRHGKEFSGKTFGIPLLSSTISIASSGIAIYANSLKIADF